MSGIQLFEQGPAADPGQPHAHEFTDPAQTEHAVVEALLAGPGQFASTWLRLTVRSQLAAWRAINARALATLAALTAARLSQAQSAGEGVDVPGWVARAIEAARATELNQDVLTQAWLAEYHDRGVRARADASLAAGAGQAVLGSLLMAAELDGDSVRVRALMRHSSGPDEVREALVQVAEALVAELGEATGGDAQQVFRALLAG